MKMSFGDSLESSYKDLFGYFFLRSMCVGRFYEKNPVAHLTPISSTITIKFGMRKTFNTMVKFVPTVPREPPFPIFPNSHAIVCYCWLWFTLVIERKRIKGESLWAWQCAKCVYVWTSFLSLAISLSLSLCHTRLVTYWAVIIWTHPPC